MLEGIGCIPTSQDLGPGLPMGGAGNVGIDCDSITLVNVYQTLREIQGSGFRISFNAFDDDGLACKLILFVLVREITSRRCIRVILPVYKTVSFGSYITRQVVKLYRPDECLIIFRCGWTKCFNNFTWFQVNCFLDQR